MEVQKYTATVTLSHEALEDARYHREWMTTMSVLLNEPLPPTRYRRVQAQGFWHAVKLFREGKLRIVDGELAA